MNPTLSFAPAHEGAIWQGGKYRRLSVQGETIDAAEFGRVVHVPRMAIGYREGDSVMWEEITPGSRSASGAIRGPVSGSSHGRHWKTAAQSRCATSCGG